jgi:hypothetical protein
MTEDRRRAEDVYELVVNLTARFDEWVAIRERVGGDDEVLRMAAEHRQLVADVPMIKADVEELAETMLGTSASDLQGGGRYSDGLVHDVKEIKASVNGQSKLTAGQRWALGLAALGPLATVIAAWVLTSGS